MQIRYVRKAEWARDEPDAPAIPVLTTRRSNQSAAEIALRGKMAGILFRTNLATSSYSRESVCDACISGGFVHMHV